MTIDSLLDRILALPLGRLTGDAQVRRNIFWGTLAGLLGGATFTLAAGDMWTGFLAKTGFSTTQIGLLTSVNTFTSAFGLLAFMGLADRIERRIRTCAIIIACLALSPVIVSGIALIPRSLLPLPAMLGVLIGLVIVQMLVTAIWTMLSYPITVRTVPPEIRGRMFAIGATSFSILGIGLGWLSGTVLKNVAYPMGYVWCFLAAASAMLLQATAFARQRELPELAVPGASRSALPFASIVRVLRLKEFQWLAPPHILRGLCSGVAALAIPVATKCLALPDQYPGYAAATNNAAGILGGIALGLISDRLGAGRTTLIGDGALALGMGTMIALGSGPAFLGLYLLLHFGRNIEDNAVPFGCTIIVPPEHMGAFSAARLMVLYGSTALGSLLFGYLFDHYDPVLLFALAGLLKLANGIWFWYVFGLKKPMHLAIEAESAGAEPASGEAATKAGRP